MRLETPYKVVSMAVADVSDFAAALTEEDFNLDKRRNGMGNLEHCHSIMLRYSGSYVASGEGRPRDALTDFPLMGKYRKYIDPVIAELKLHYSFVDYVAVIAGLHPSCHIGAHRDRSDMSWVCHKIHIPLITTPACLYTVGEATWHMEKGLVYEIDNDRVHTCFNGGEANRVHLIMSLCTQ